MTKAIPRRIAFFIALLAISFAAVGQTPTADQLEMFRNLPPEQQKTLLETLNKDSQEPTNATDRTRSGAVPEVKQDPTTREDSEKQQARGTGAPRAIPGSTLILSVDPVADSILYGDTPSPLPARRERILAGNPYRLNSQGELGLLLLPGIPVAGLTAVETAYRLNADPRLVGLKFSVTLLPLTPSRNESLKLFGSGLFEEETISFRTRNNIPVPTDYVVGPGDQLIIEYSGKRSSRSTLVVNRDGQINLPEIGPMQVSGVKFDALRNQIERRVAGQTIGVDVNVSMGQLRSIQVFVLGDVSHPGTCTVSAMSTIVNALLECGGISHIGSLRNITLKRSGATVGKLDLYDMLLNGDTSNDRRVQPGDVVFVPPLGETASVSGEVRRPAIYELKPNSTVGDLLALSGGLTPEADPTVAQVERIDAQQQRVVMSLNANDVASKALTLRSGDSLSVARVLDETTNGIELIGHVQRPGKFAWHEGMRLTELLGRLDNLKESADQRYVVIRRESLPSRRIEVISVDAQQAFAAPTSGANPLMQPRDRVMVFGMEGDRGTAMAEVLNTLRLQVRDNNSPPVVSIQGRVRAPGDYPLESAMRVRDLLRAGGGLDEAAYRLGAELTRYEVVNGDVRQTAIVPIDLNQAVIGAGGSDVELKPYDVLVIKQIPEWADQGDITLNGEVRFPGRYPIRRGEKLSDVIERAGGLTEHAFPEGSVFTRAEIKEQERKQIEALTERMRADLAAMAVRSAQTEGNKDTSQALTIGQSLLTQLNSTKPVGRLVIDLKRALERKKRVEDDVELRSGDVLTIPRLKQYVTVVGEVQNATAHIYKRGLNRQSYVELSGGVTRRADKRRIYVVRADGSVAATGGSSWFGADGNQMRPGDSVVVPLDTERMRPLPLWTSITTIIYNLAIAAAAVNSF